MGKFFLTDTDGILWHSPSEGPLSRPFTNYTHNTSYRPNARGGLSSNFSQSPELCVWRQANIYLPQQLTTGDRNICHFLGLRCVFTRVPGRRDLDTQIRERTQSSWSAFIYYVNARLHGRTRNDRLLVGPVAPNYECHR